MSDHSRRALLTGGLRAALGAGGLLLPWQGGGALALSDVVADVPVVSGPFPVSVETLALREILARRAALYARHHRTQAEREDCEVAQILNQFEYAETANKVLDRPVTSWGRVAELAEIAWACWPKVWYGPEPGMSGRLDLDGRQYRGCHDHNASRQAAAAQLIHAVVTLSEAPRFSPRWPCAPLLDGRFSQEELSELCGQGRIGRMGGADV